MSTRPKREFRDPEDIDFRTEMKIKELDDAIVEDAIDIWHKLNHHFGEKEYNKLPLAIALIDHLAEIIESIGNGPFEDSKQRDDWFVAQLLFRLGEVEID